MRYEYPTGVIEPGPEQHPQTKPLVQFWAIESVESQEVERIVEEWHERFSRDMSVDQIPSHEGIKEMIRSEIEDVQRYSELMRPVVDDAMAFLHEELVRQVPELAKRPSIRLMILGTTTRKTIPQDVKSCGGQYVPESRQAYVVLTKEQLSRQFPVYLLMHEVSHAYSDHTEDLSDQRIGFNHRDSQKEPLGEDDPSMNEGITTLIGHRLAEAWRGRGVRTPDGFEGVYEYEGDYWKDWELAREVEAYLGTEVLLRAYFTTEGKALYRQRMLEKFTSTQFDAWRQLPIDARISVFRGESVVLGVTDWSRDSYQAYQRQFPDLITLEEEPPGESFDDWLERREQEGFK